MNIKNKFNRWNVIAISCFFFLLFSFAGINKINATHIVGGELSYRVVGFERVEVTLIVRRDCALGDPEADFDPIAFFPIWNGFNDVPVNRPTQFQIDFNSQDTLHEIISGCEVSGDLVCVQEAVYKKTFNLSPAGVNNGGYYRIAYERCCRNSSLQNVGPTGDEVGMINEIIITDEEITSYNKAPTLPSFPPIYACVGENISWNQGGVDPNGDDLVYRLSTPNDGRSQDDPWVTNRNNATKPPYAVINWAAPYNQLNMIPTAPGDELRIDPVTGVMTAKPNATGQYLISFCVDEIRDNRIFNTTCREFQLNIRLCGDRANACFNAPPIQCDDLTVDFDNCAEGDTIRWFFDSENSNDFIDNSNANVSHTFPDTGLYVVMQVAINEGGCNDTLRNEVNVKISGLIDDDGNSLAGYEFLQSSCVDSIDLTLIDTTTATISPIVLIEWTLIYGGDIVTDTGKMTNLILYADETITVIHRVVLENGCELIAQTEIVLELLDHNAPDSLDVCQNTATDFTINTNPNAIITWVDNDTIIESQSTDGKTIVINSKNDGIHYLYFTITNEFNCQLTDTLVVNSEMTVNIDFTAQFDCESRTVYFENLSDDNDSLIWYFGNDSTSTERNPIHTYLEDGTYSVTLTIQEPNDCTQEKVLNIDIDTDDVLIDGDTIGYCFYDELWLNPNGDPSYSYVWRPNNLVSDSTAVNPLSLATESTYYYVTITKDRGDFTCETLDTLFLEILGNDIDLNVIYPNDGSGNGHIIDTTICSNPGNEGESLDFKFIVSAHPDADLCWTILGDTTVIGMDSTLDVNIDMSTTYIISAKKDGCIDRDTIEVNITREEINLDFDIFNPDGSVVTCVPDTLKIAVIPSPAGNYMFIWSTINGQILGDTMTDTLCIFAAGDEQYFITAINKDLGCEVMDTVNVNLDMPTLNLTLNPSGIICEGDTVCLIANANPPGLDFVYTWNVGGPIIGDDTGDTIKYIATTSHLDMVTATAAGGCVINDELQVDVTNINVTATADPSMLEDEDTEIQLGVLNGDPNWSYMWEGPALSNPNIIDPTSIPGLDGAPHKYTVFVEDENGCMDMSMVFVRPPDTTNNECAPPFVFLPNIFSPNGDNNNDVLFVRGNDIVNMKLVIYNRWGQEIFVSTEQTDGWDGTYKGDEVEADVYGYYLSVDCGEEKKYYHQGNVTVSR